MTARATNLRTEFLTDPLGIDEVSPRFSWWIDDPRPGARQTDYRVRVASSPERLERDEPDLWDSGEVASDRQAHVAYAGIALTSRVRGYWDVTLWDADGARGLASAPATFELGLLEQADWSASWITTPIEEPALTLPPVPILRRTFQLDRP